MTRVFLTIVVPLLLPSALYFGWLAGFGRAAVTGEAGEARAVPWAWLAATGMALAGAALIAVTQFGGAKEGSYVPPHLDNGSVVPGQFVPEQ